jgi:hypothetical protein
MSCVSGYVAVLMLSTLVPLGRPTACNRCQFKSVPIRDAWHTGSTIVISELVGVKYKLLQTPLACAISSVERSELLGANQGMWLP